MKWQPSRLMLAVMSRTDSKTAGRGLGAKAEIRIPGVSRRADVRVVPKCWLRRLTIWLVANDGMSERFAVERQRDQELIRRVDRIPREWRD